MEVQVKYYAMVREAAGRKSEGVFLPPGSTLRDLIGLLADRYGGRFSGYLLDGEGEPREYISYMVNGVDSHSLRGLETGLDEGDIVAFIPPIGGG